MKSIFIITGLLLLLVVPVSSVASGEKCQDIKGEMKWGDKSHSDNNPSEKAFFGDMDKQTFCSFIKDIDHMEKKGAVREDTKHDWDWFKQTMVYLSVDEDEQSCLKHKYNLPDDGKKNLEAYEFLECTY